MFATIITVLCLLLALSVFLNYKTLKDLLQIKDVLELDKITDTVSMVREKVSQNDTFYEEVKKLEGKVKKMETQHGKDLEDANALLKVEKDSLKDVSQKICKIMDVVREENPDEDIDELIQKFDAFYVLNASLVKNSRLIEHFKGLYFTNKKKYKKSYDRLRTVCKKYNEPLVAKKQKKRRRKAK